MEVECQTLVVCPACGGDRLRTYLRSRDYESGTGDYRVDECAACSHQFTNPRPLERELPKLYEQRDTTDFVKSRPWIEALRAVAVSRFLKSIDPFIGGSRNILDYGAGDGFFTRELSRRYRDAHVVGTDFHSSPPALIASLPSVRYLSQSELLHESQVFDLIVMRHVLEHCIEPTSTIEMLRGRLAPEGILLIEVPNRESAWARIFGTYYSALYLPRHLSHFSRHSLTSVLKGFSVEKALAGDIPLIGKSLGNLLGLPIGNVGAVGLALYPVQCLVDRVLGRSSTLIVLARKVS